MIVLFGMPLRQTTGFVQSLLRLVGLDWNVPVFSTHCRGHRKQNVSIPYRGGAGPLNLLDDSTGINTEGEGEGNARKHGGAKRRIWRKVHIGIDEQTLEVRAVEIIDRAGPPMLKILQGHMIGENRKRFVMATDPLVAPALEWGPPRQFQLI